VRVITAATDDGQQSHAVVDGLALASDPCARQRIEDERHGIVRTRRTGLL
jgi:hypothetical protein